MALSDTAEYWWREPRMPYMGRHFVHIPNSNCGHIKKETGNVDSFKFNRNLFLSNFFIRRYPYWTYYNALYPIGKSVWEYFYHSCGLIYCFFSLSNYSTFAISCPHHIFIRLRLRFYFNSYLLKTIYLIKELVLKVKTFNYKKTYLYTILLTSYDTI